MNVCTKFHIDPSCSFWVHLVWTKVVDWLSDQQSDRAMLLAWLKIINSQLINNDNIVIVYTPHTVRYQSNGPAGLSHSWVTEESPLQQPLLLPTSAAIHRPSIVTQQFFIDSTWSSRPPLNFAKLWQEEKPSPRIFAKLSSHTWILQFKRISEDSELVQYQLSVI